MTDAKIPTVYASASKVDFNIERQHVSVRLRLTRVGAKKDPIWRVVVADQRSPRDGRVIETIGHYNAQTNPSTIKIDEERARSWLARGAQPSDTVRKLLRTQGIGS
jgi:small subunit ribosomal protein S16